MKNRLKALVVLSFGALLVFGWDFHPGVSATVPGVNEGISVSSSGGSPNDVSDGVSLSQSGRYAAFSSRATNLVQGVTVSGNYNEVYVRDRLNNTTTLASISSSGVAANGDSAAPNISADGRYVVFKSTAANIGSDGSTYHIFLHDMKTGTTSIVDTNSSGQADWAVASNYSSVSADGRYVAFGSASINLVSSPSLSHHGYWYVYLKDMKTGGIKLLSVGTGATEPDGSSGFPKIDCGGDEIAFYSFASNLVDNDTNGKEDVFLYNQIDHSTTDITIGADDHSSNGSISCNGEYVTLTSTATNLTSISVPSSVQNAYEYDRINNKFTLVSQSTTGNIGNADSQATSVNNDGTLVAISSIATNLTSSDSDVSGWDVFLRNTETDTTEMVDINSNGIQANAPSYAPILSANGRYIGYASPATNLVTGYGYSASGEGAAYVSQTGLTDTY